MDVTYRVVIFSLQSRFCFNIDIDLKSMDLSLKFNEEAPRTVVETFTNLIFSMSELKQLFCADTYVVCKIRNGKHLFLN